MEAAAMIPQTKQLAYRPNSSSSSPVDAIVPWNQVPVWAETSVKAAAVSEDAISGPAGFQNKVPG